MNPRTPRFSDLSDLSDEAPSDPASDDRSVADVALDVVETLGALVACTIVFTLPLWLALLAGTLTGALGGMFTFLLSSTLIVTLPALLPIDERPELNAAERWGLRVGRFFRRPLVGEARAPRALGADTSTSSAAAPSLPPAPPR